MNLHQHLDPASESGWLLMHMDMPSLILSGYNDWKTAETG